MSGFISELKRRNVIRMAGLYLVGAWLVAQIAETLLPIFHTPEWVLQSLVVLLGIGFLPALVVAWIFELTPVGLKRDSEVAPEQSIALLAERRGELLDDTLESINSPRLGFNALSPWRPVCMRVASMVRRSSTTIRIRTCRICSSVDPSSPRHQSLR